MQISYLVARCGLAPAASGGRREPRILGILAGKAAGMRIFDKFRGCLNRIEGGGGRRKSPRAFIAHTGGAVAIIFGLTLVPVLGLAGGALDYANAYRMRSKLQDALDTATLAAGREVDMGRSVDEAKSTANRVLDANLGDDAPSYTTTLNIDPSGGIVTASADMRVDTYLLGVLGQDYFDVHVDSTVKLPKGKVEVAMVLDNSRSMAGGKIRDLRDAARRLTEILFENSRGEDWVRIGLVPFAASVNVGPAHANASWMDTEGRSSIHYENFDIDASSGVTRFDLYRQMRNTEWNGCVEVRPEPHDVTDSSPTPGDGNSYFVPMFAPDEPDQGRYGNNYLDDDGGSCESAGGGRGGGRGRGRGRGNGGGGDDDGDPQARTCKYDDERPFGKGPNFLCDSQEIQELSSNQGRVASAIDDMRANGLTNIHEGVMWGWRVLSPGEPFAEGRAYDDDDNTKVMIVMTDGENTHRGDRPDPNKSDYSAYGFAGNGRLTAPTSNERRLVEAMNEKTATSCANAKANDVVIYTIAVGVRDSDTLDMLSQCATTASRAFSIEDADALTSVFEAIAGEINKLRIAS